MKITKSQLKQIIKEELDEITDRNTVINPETGEEERVQMELPSWKRTSAAPAPIKIPSKEREAIQAMLDKHYDAETHANLAPGAEEQAIRDIWSKVQEMAYNFYNA
jgi:hypothetical protein